jgi:hypothetical protein
VEAEGEGGRGTGGRGTGVDSAVGAGAAPAPERVVLEEMSDDDVCGDDGVHLSPRPLTPNLKHQTLNPKL